MAASRSVARLGMGPVLRSSGPKFSMVAALIKMLRDKGNLHKGHVYYLAQKQAEELVKNGDAELYKEPGPSETK